MVVSTFLALAFHILYLTDDRDLDLGEKEVVVSPFLALAFHILYFICDRDADLGE